MPQSHVAITSRAVWCDGRATMAGAPSFAAAPGAAPSTPAAPAASKGRIVLCELTGRDGWPRRCSRWADARHCGDGPSRHGGAAGRPGGKTKATFEAAGLKIVGVEGAPVAFEKMKLDWMGG